MTNDSIDNSLKNIEKWLEKETLTNDEIATIYVENLAKGGDPILFARKVLEKAKSK